MTAPPNVHSEEDAPRWSLPAKLGRIFADHGVLEGTGLLASLCLDVAIDRMLGVRTRGKFYLSENGVEREDYTDYAPIDYLSAWTRLRAVKPTSNDVFVEYGAGRGRVVILAAMMPFRQVLGVELDPDLVANCRENLARTGRQFRCPQVEAIHSDAVDFDLPDDATVLHFFHPFYGDPLEAVAQKIAESLRRNPRALRVLFANPFDFERIVHQTSIFPKNWLQSQSCHRWPLYQTDGIGNLYRDYQFDSR